MLFQQMHINRMMQEQNLNAQKVQTLHAKIDELQKEIFELRKSDKALEANGLTLAQSDSHKRTAMEVKSVD